MGRGRWTRWNSINPLNVDVYRRGTRRHYEILYSVKLNRELGETRSTNSVEFRAIISPFDTDVRFRRESLHARVPCPRAASLSLSLVSRVNPASLNRARNERHTYRLDPFFSLCTSFDKNVAFVEQARCRDSIP